MEGAVTWQPRVEPCPSCGTTMENDPRYAFWCDACDWNLVRPSDRDERGPVDRFLAGLGRRRGHRLTDDVIRRGAARPGLDLAILGAVAIAVAVYALAASLAALGIASIAIGGGLAGWVIGAICLLFAFVLRPRVPMVDGTVRSRAELPRLFALLDRVAEGVGTERVDGVVLQGDVNAGFGRFGWRRRRILFLGVPLFQALDPAERVALLGHELGHAVSGDSGRSLVIGGAVNALIEFWSVVEPDSILPSPEEGFTGYVAIPLRIVQLAFARAVLALALLQLLLCYRTSQRAEFHADAIACRLAGSRGAARLLTRLHAAEPAARLAWSNRPADPIATIAERVRLMPDREIERLRRIERIQGSRFDATHPSTVERERLVAGLSAQPGSLVLTTGESDAIDRELEPFREGLGRELAERATAALG